MVKILEFIFIVGFIALLALPIKDDRRHIVVHDQKIYMTEIDYVSCHDEEFLHVKLFSDKVYTIQDVNTCGILRMYWVEWIEEGTFRNK